MAKTLLTILAFSLLALAPVAPQDEDSVWASSYALEAQGKYGEAAALLEPLFSGPAGELAHLRHGWLNYLMHNYNVARRSYSAALTLNNASLDARLGLSMCLLAQQRWKEAALHSRAVLRDAPWNLTAHHRLLMSEEGQGNWTKMRDHSQQICLRFPTDVTAWVYRARAAIWMGDRTEALSLYRQVLRLSPQHAEARAYLAKDDKKAESGV